MNHKAELKLEVFRRLLETIPADSPSELVRARLETVLNSIELGDREREILFNDIQAELGGLGPIGALLKDDEIQEIFIVGTDIRFVSRGLLYPMYPLPSNRFPAQHLKTFTSKLLSSFERTDDSSLITGSLPDGSQVIAIAEPLVQEAPLVRIVKRNVHEVDLETLLKLKALSKPMSDVLAACARGRLNIVISGSAGAGAWTFCKVLAKKISQNEIVISLSDDRTFTPGLSRVHQIVATNGTDQAELVRHIQLIRPDRLLLDGISHQQAFEFLQFINDTARGSFCTMYSEGPYDALRRLELMISLRHSNLSQRAIRQLIVSAIDLLVHCERLDDGARKITHVTEIIGLEHDEIVLQDIFTFVRSGVGKLGRVLGTFVGSGSVPAIARSLRQSGIDLPETSYQSNVELLDGE